MGRPKLGSYRYGITSLCCKPAMHEEAERPEVRPKWTHFTEFLRCKVLVDAAADLPKLGRFHASGEVDARM